MREKEPNTPKLLGEVFPTLGTLCLKLTSLDPGIAALGREFQERLAPIFAGVNAAAKAIESLPTRTQSALTTLGMNGWYLDEEMPLVMIFELAEAYESGHEDAADEAFTEYYERELERIEASFVELHPRRAHLICSALRAHREGFYELSIPLLLTQAEGVCKDLTGLQLYTRRSDKSVAKHVKKTRDETIGSVFMHPLTLVLPIKGGIGGKARNPLSRHAVLHGETIDYDTRTNGAKAISLVLYCSQVLRLAKD